MASNADKILSEARKWLGHYERRPQRDNQGWDNPQTYSGGSWVVNKSQRDAGYSTPVPWCGCFVVFCANRAGYKSYQHVSNGGVGHGATAITYSEARRRGWLKRKPVAGALMIRNGVHVGIVDRVYDNGTYSTIEGNSDDAVSARVRSVKDNWHFIVPPDLGTATNNNTQVMYAFERTDVKIYGGWRTKAIRNQQMRRFKKEHPDWWTRPIKTTKPQPYSFEAGPPGSWASPQQFGGWSSKSIRDEQLSLFRKANPGVPTRTYNYRRRISGPPPSATGYDKFS